MEWTDSCIVRVTKKVDRHLREHENQLWNSASSSLVKSGSVTSFLRKRLRKYSEEFLSLFKQLKRIAQPTVLFPHSRITLFRGRSTLENGIERLPSWPCINMTFPLIHGGVSVLYLTGPTNFFCRRANKNRS